MTTQSLVSHLLNLPVEPKYSLATQHEFLQSISSDPTYQPVLQRLSLWLSQDRIYAAHAYPRFIGALITRIPFSHTHRVSSPEDTANQGILKVLTYALQNIVTEVNFFGHTAQKYGFNLDGWKQRKGTRDYTAEMARVATQGSLEDGLIFLWAMEKVYLDAWSYVSSVLTSSGRAYADGAVSSFAANWTSEEFNEFVGRLSQLVDGLGIQPGSDQWKRAEEIWQRVVELEFKFWPEKGEEEELRLQ